jgi:hypothetical protein
MSEQAIRRIVREELAAASAIQYHYPTIICTCYDEDGIVVHSGPLSDGDSLSDAGGPNPKPRPT